MATIAIEKKRKNIDLSVDTLKKLSIMAASQGKSVKAFIENLLETKANSLSIEVSTNPSPSGDPWFDDPENMASVMRGIEDAKQGKKKDLAKIFSLFQELEEHPTTGTGQVEQLKGNLSGFWSRRIDKHYRIIYAIHEEIVTVEVVSVKSHYGDK